MNLGDMKTQLTGLMNRRDLTANTSLQQTFIDQAVMRIQRELRCPAMEKAVIVTVNSDYAGLVIPSDMLELISIIPSTCDDKLEKVDITRALKLSRVQGVPEVYERQGGAWILGPAPQLNDTIRVDYYAELSPLVSPSDENVISKIAWDLIVYAALVQAAVHFKDSRKDDFEMQYQTILAGLQDQSEADEEAECAAVMPAYTFECDWPY